MRIKRTGSFEGLCVYVCVCVCVCRLACVCRPLCTIVCVHSCVNACNFACLYKCARVGACLLVSRVVVVAAMSFFSYVTHSSSYPFFASHPSLFPLHLSLYPARFVRLSSRKNKEAIVNVKSKLNKFLIKKETTANDSLLLITML